MYGKDFEKELEGHEAQFPEDRKRAALLLSLHSVQDRKGWPSNIVCDHSPANQNPGVLR